MICILGGWMKINHHGGQRIYCMLTICLMIAVLIPIQAVADEPYYINGTVKTSDTGQPVTYTNVQIKNMRTNETQNTTTDNQGTFHYNLVGFQQGWQSGDYFYITSTPPLGYSNYGCALLFDILGMISHNRAMDSYCYPNNPEDPWTDDMGSLNCANRQISPNNFIWISHDDGVHIPTISTGSWQTLLFRLGYSYYDDSGSNWPSVPSDPNTFHIRIYDQFDVKNAENAAVVYDSKMAICGYDITKGGNEKRFDPYLRCYVPPQPCVDHIHLGFYMYQRIIITYTQLNQEIQYSDSGWVPSFYSGLIYEYY